MDTQKTQKNAQYFCEICDFGTNNKTDFNRHILTRKHTRKQQCVIGNKKRFFGCENCGKNYISRSGLYKHSKKCLASSEGTTEDCFPPTNSNKIVNEEFKKVEENFKKVEEKFENNQNTQMFSLIMKQGEILESLIKKLGDAPSSKIMNNNNNNNNNNNTTNQINLNVYLNDTCKDAGNLPEFIENISLHLTDLISVKDEGLLKSTKNIFLKELQNTEQIKRPIQCTDIKRKTLYVKEEGEWSKDVGNEKLKGAIRSLSQKHIPLVKNLTCQEGDKSLNSEEYVQVVKSATTDVLEETRGLQRAVREICQETYMKGGVE